MHSGPEFAYLRQSVRTNNAAVIARGATKPTSVLTTVRVADKLDVVAHLSEGVPRYWFTNNDTWNSSCASTELPGLSAQSAVDQLGRQRLSG